MGSIGTDLPLTALARCQILSSPPTPTPKNNKQGVLASRMQRRRAPPPSLAPKAPLSLPAAGDAGAFRNQELVKNQGGSRTTCMVCCHRAGRWGEDETLFRCPPSPALLSRQAPSTTTSWAYSVAAGLIEGVCGQGDAGGGGWCSLAGWLDVDDDIASGASYSTRTSREATPPQHLISAVLRNNTGGSFDPTLPSFPVLAIFSNLMKGRVRVSAVHQQLRTSNYCS